MNMYNPPHPGAVLREYLGKVSVTDAAVHLGVTRAALSRILNGSAGISADMSLRLSEALGTSPDFWAKMQTEYDLWEASKKRRKRLQRLDVAPAIRL
jgi:addiction module HigA family antidote